MFLMYLQIVQSPEQSVLWRWAFDFARYSGRCPQKQQPKLPTEMLEAQSLLYG